jgi:hypothetical protein
MYTTKPGLILGFHGCDRSLVNDILSGTKTLINSDNEYDWLGHGVYFWENSTNRAFEYARHLKNNPRDSRSIIEEPAVIGAVINLGYCLDLLDYKNLKLLKSAYDILRINHDASNFPQNKKGTDSNELMIRELDCAVIETVHTIMGIEGEGAFDSVKGVFFEGETIYPGAGFREKDHIQICIRNPNCIKGYFLPREVSKDYNKV